MPLWSELNCDAFLRSYKSTEVAIMVTGATESHGTHLPLGTDTFMPEYLARKVASRTNAMVLPAIPFGDSWTFEDFKGTITIENSTLVRYYCDVMKSVFNHGFRYIIALNGHGGNTSALEQAAKLATGERERFVIVVNWWRDLAKEVREEVLETNEGHAAEDETSEVMYVLPESVNMKVAVAGRVVTKFTIISAGFRNDLYPSAIYGDPSKASAEKGEAIMNQAEEELVLLIGDLERGKLPLEKS